MPRKLSAYTRSVRTWDDRRLIEKRVRRPVRPARGMSAPAMTRVLDDAGLLRELTGMRPGAFLRVHAAFTRVWDAEQCERTVRGRRRQRERGAGLKGSLGDTRAMLVFILFYHRWNPSQQALGSLFGMTQQWVSLWLRHLTPLLEEAQGKSIPRSHRKPSNLAALLAAVPSAIALAEGADPAPPALAAE